MKAVALTAGMVGLLIAGAAQAAELEAMAGRSIRLGNLTGSAYYTVEQDGYQIVATVAADEGVKPVRFVATLASGQKVIVSVPREVGQSDLSVEFKRIGDRVFVDEGPKLSSAE